MVVSRAVLVIDGVELGASQKPGLHGEVTLGAPPARGGRDRPGWVAARVGTGSLAGRDPGRSRRVPTHRWPTPTAGCTTVGCRVGMGGQTLGPVDGLA